jgi:SAM-dependent methyltransferase
MEVILDAALSILRGPQPPAWLWVCVLVVAMTAMLDFYQQHGIAPVKQDIGDLSAHFQRRAFLYRQLGLWPKSIEGKRVLEVGPGTGENARYTASLEPASYTLMEPNDTARARLYETYAHADPYATVEISDQSLDTFTSAAPYDVVLCEGLLGLSGGDPRGLLTQLGNQVAVGGVLVVTCIDAISDCAEVLRRALAQRYIRRDASLQKNVAILKPICAPHLATLKGMTRSVEDWILDNILNPASIGPTFSIPDALEHVDGKFEVLGCSPRFLIDWRWYKEATPGNAWAIESYWRNCHNLYDYRKVKPESTRSRNESFMAWCEDIREGVRGLEAGGPGNVWARTDELRDDPSWFGRGQQYLSLVRVA